MIAVSVAVPALIVIVIIQQRLIVAQKKAKESQRMVETLHKQVFVDALTQVQNKGGFDECVRQLQERIDRGEVPETAVGVFDCDNLKLVNDQYGHEKGNAYLLASCQVICRIFKHSPVFRIGGDEFAVVLSGEDYERREELLRRFQAEQSAISASAQNAWEQVGVSVGAAVFDPRLDRSMKDLIQRADRLMYENKRSRKKTQQKSR